MPDADQPVPADRPVYADQAVHVDEHSDNLIALCRGAVAADGGLIHVAHYTRGIYDFAVDRLEEPAMSAGKVDQVREERRRVGRQLNFTVGRLEEMLQPLQSGRLIRLVLDFGRSAVYYFTTRQGEYLVGLALDGTRIEAADEMMADLATGIRDLHRLGPEDPGGFQHRPARVPASARPRPEVYGAADLDVAHARMARICGDAVHPKDLHYIAHHHEGDLGFGVDVLADPSLRVFFRDITPEARRSRYQEIGRLLVPLSRRLDRQIHELTGGQLTRTILDVEEGALYYHRLGGGEFLLGVTVDQAMVLQADRRMAEVLGKIRDDDGTGHL
jgi:hypothetical protein